MGVNAVGLWFGVLKVDDIVDVYHISCHLLSKIIVHPNIVVRPFYFFNFQFFDFFLVFLCDLDIFSLQLLRLILMVIGTVHLVFVLSFQITQLELQSFDLCDVAILHLLQFRSTLLMRVLKVLL